jgi:hypothetical protein
VYQYFSVKLTQITARLGEVTSKVPDGIYRIFDTKVLKNCTLGHGNLKKEPFEQLEIGKYLCAENTQFTLQG